MSKSKAQYLSSKYCQHLKRRPEGYRVDLPADSPQNEAWRAWAREKNRLRDELEMSVANSKGSWLHTPIIKKRKTIASWIHQFYVLLEKLDNCNTQAQYDLIYESLYDSHQNIIQHSHSSLVKMPSMPLKKEFPK